MTVCVNGISAYNINQTSRLNNRDKSVANTQTPINNAQTTSFRGVNDKTSVSFRTKLSTKEEQQQFNAVSKELQPDEEKASQRTFKKRDFVKR